MTTRYIRLDYYSDFHQRNGTLSKLKFAEIDVMNLKEIKMIDDVTAVSKRDMDKDLKGNRSKSADGETTKIKTFTGTDTDLDVETKLRNSKESKGVQPMTHSIPLLQCRDIIDKEMMWLIPLGLAHLQSVWEDDNTHPSIIDTMLKYTMTLQDAQEHGLHNKSNTFFSSPYELLMTLDAVRRYVRTVRISE